MTSFIYETLTLLPKLSESGHISSALHLGCGTLASSLLPTWLCTPKSSGLSQAVSLCWDSCTASGGQSWRTSTSRLSLQWYWAGLTTATSRRLASWRTSSIVCSWWWMLQQDWSLACSAITDMLASLHWLCSSECIQYKLVMTMFRSLHGLAPPYSSDDLHLLADIPSRRRLRSVSSLQLDVLSTHRRTALDRAFAAAGPTLWNSLPHDITGCVSLTLFCRKLKTFLFSLSFPRLRFSIFSGPWGNYLGHFKNFLCMYVCKLLVLYWLINDSCCTLFVWMAVNYSWLIVVCEINRRSVVSLLNKLIWNPLPICVH